LITGSVDVNVKTKDSRTTITTARNEDYGDILVRLQKASAQ